MSSRSNHVSRSNDPTGDVPAPTLRALLCAVHDAEVLVATLGFGAGGQAASVEKLRPGRPLSERTIAVTWGGSTRAFAEQGVLPAILSRLPADCEKQAMAAYEELQETERGEAPARARERTSFNENRDG